MKQESKRDIVKRLRESLTAQQRSVPQLPAQARAKKISVLGSKTDPKHPFDGYMVGADESAEPGKKSIGPDMNNPYEQGWRAGFRHNESNPYPAGSEEAAQWDRGYAEAEAQPNHYDESALSEFAPGPGRDGDDDDNGDNDYNSGNDKINTAANAIVKLLKSKQPVFFQLPDGRLSQIRKISPLNVSPINQDADGNIIGTAAFDIVSKSSGGRNYLDQVAIQPDMYGIVPVLGKKIVMQVADQNLPPHLKRMRDTDGDLTETVSPFSADHREIDQFVKEEFNRDPDDLDEYADLVEGLKSKLAGAVLAGAAAFGGGGIAHAQGDMNHREVVQQIQSGKIQNAEQLLSVIRNAKNIQTVWKMLQFEAKKAGMTEYATNDSNGINKVIKAISNKKTNEGIASGSNPAADWPDFGKVKTYESQLDEAKQRLGEGWSQKYKSSINCSHPKGFSQKAHCAGKKKHNESVEMEMVCESCGMCETHGNVMEIKKGQKDSNGYTRCWPGKHAEGTKKGKNGGPVRNCVPNESVAENWGEPLTGWHVVYARTGNKVHGTPDFDSRESAHKYLMNKMSANHHNYRVAHADQLGTSAPTPLGGYLESKSERNEMDTPAVQAALKNMSDRHKNEKWSKEQLAALGKRLAAQDKNKKGVDETVSTHKGGKITKTPTGIKHQAAPGNYGGYEPELDHLQTLDKSETGRIERSMDIKHKRKKAWQGGIDLDEAVTKEDIITKLNAKLGDYLSNIGQQIKNDPTLQNKLTAKTPGDQVGPPVKTLTTDDGHEIQIHGNEDDGFRVSIKNKQTPSKFDNLDEAVMACEMYCAHRRKQALNADYIDEA